MTQDQTALGTRKSFVAPLLVSATLVAPFIVLQWVNRRTFHEAFPFVLFTFMSLHSLFIVLLLTPALRRLRAERSLRALNLVQLVRTLAWCLPRIRVCHCGYRPASLLPRSAELRLGRRER